MSCLAVTGSGDIAITNGRLSITQDPDIATAIKLGNRLQLFLGEWFLDTRIGVPYYQLVYVKNPNLTTVAQLFRRVILQTPRCIEVLEANLDFISNLRELIAMFKVRTESGAILTGGAGLPFIVEYNGKGAS